MKSVSVREIFYTTYIVQSLVHLAFRDLNDAYSECFVMYITNCVLISTGIIDASFL